MNKSVVHKYWPSFLFLVYQETSIEYLADISDPQVPPNDQKDQKINFPSVYQVSMREIAFLPLKPE